VSLLAKPDASTMLPREHNAVAAWVRRYVVPRQAPWPAVMVVCMAIAIAFSPNVIEVYGVHNDYEMLHFKSHSFFHNEAETLFGIARPVAALLTNLTVLPVQSLADYRWTRIFSILTMCLMGCQLVALCIYRLRTSAIDAVAVALVTLLGPPFIYSVLNASAWSPHLLSVLLVLVAYAVLGGANVLLASFGEAFERRDLRLLQRQVWQYCRLEPVWIACIVYQLALFDHPPNAMMLALFPVVAALFSRAPVAYRALLAARDFAFIGGNIVLYTLAVKLVYLPIVGLFTSMPPPYGSALGERIIATYRFDFNFDPSVAAVRLGNLLKVAGDLWFLPQTAAHIALGGLVLLAFVLAQLPVPRRRASPQDAASQPLLSRIGVSSGAAAALGTIAVPCVSLLVGSSTIIASATGFVTYRTIAVAIAILAVICLFAVRGIVDWAARLVMDPGVAVRRAGDAAVALIACTAVAANFYMNDLTMRLARNEFAYFSGVVRQAVERKADVIVSCVDLAKTYAAERGEIEAVRGIDFEMRAGEFTSIVGRSGSGKSSFLAMIGGLSRPSRGSLRIPRICTWRSSRPRNSISPSCVHRPRSPLR